MTIARVYVAGWAVGEKLTSAQQNAVDINVTNALDKRSGGDTLSGRVVMANAGRIVGKEIVYVAGATYQVGVDYHTIHVTDASLTTGRLTNLDLAGAVDGDTLAFYMDPDSTTYTLTIRNSGGVTILFVLGNTFGADGNWAEFKLFGGEWILHRGGGQSRHTYSEDFAVGTSNWTAPRFCTQVTFQAYGGGGAGGNGAAGAAVADVGNTGGGGGGAARFHSIVIPVTPGTTYSIVVGAGGASPGAPGGNTSFDGAFVCRGGNGGGTGFAGLAVGSAQTVATCGGFEGVGIGVSPRVYWPSNYEIPTAPGQGGYSPCNAGTAGAGSDAGLSGDGAYQGGAGGADGAFSVTHEGGSGGGGGAAGPGFGAGAGDGDGGNGGAGNSVGTGNAGFNGSAASANTGGGGGGGGGGGAGTSGAAAGGNGGNGGSGYATLIWTR